MNVVGSLAVAPGHSITILTSSTPLATHVSQVVTSLTVKIFDAVLQVSPWTPHPPVQTAFVSVTVLLIVIGRLARLPNFRIFFAELFYHPAVLIGDESFVELLPMAYSLCKTETKN